MSDETDKNYFHTSQLLRNVGGFELISLGFSAFGVNLKLI